MTIREDTEVGREMKENEFEIARSKRIEKIYVDARQKRVSRTGTGKI